MKKEKAEKRHVLLFLPSFRFSFSDSMIENKKKVIKFPFPFS